MVAAVDRMNRDERLAPFEGRTNIIGPAEAVTRALDNQCWHGDPEQVRDAIASSAWRLEWITEHDDTGERRRICRPEIRRRRKVSCHPSAHRLAADEELRRLNVRMCGRGPNHMPERVLEDRGAIRRSPPGLSVRKVERHDIAAALGETRRVAHDKRM